MILTEEKKESLKRILLSKINKDVVNGCWNWQGATGFKGYGRIKFEQKVYLSHRISFLVFHGEDPGKLFVCHKCDNPSCLNPDHLFLGSRSENMKDCSAKGRLYKNKKEDVVFGEDVGSSKLKNSDIEKIRNLLADGWKQARIARLFGVNRSQINRIFSGKSWNRI